MDITLGIVIIVLVANFLNIISLRKKVDSMHEDLFELKDNLNKRFGLDEIDNEDY